MKDARKKRSISRVAATNNTQEIALAPWDVKRRGPGNEVASWTTYNAKSGPSSLIGSLSNDDGDGNDNDNAAKQ